MAESILTFQGLLAAIDKMPGYTPTSQELVNIQNKQPLIKDIPAAKWATGLGAAAILMTRGMVKDTLASAVRLAEASAKAAHGYDPGDPGRIGADAFNVGLVGSGLRGLSGSVPKDSAGMFGAKLPWVGPNVKDITGKTSREIADNLATFKIPTSDLRTTLGEVVDHPELFRFYPELKDAPVSFTYKHGFETGGRTRKTDQGTPEFEMSVPSGALTPEGTLVPEQEEFITGVLLHEMQHGVRMLDEKAGLASVRGSSIWQAADEWEKFKKAVEGADKIKLELPEEVIDLYKKLKFIDEKTRGAPGIIYAKKPGEIEAEMTRLGRHMTKEERAATPLEQRKGYSQPIDLKKEGFEIGLGLLKSIRDDPFGQFMESLQMRPEGGMLTGKWKS
jgi:hypothetical protein